MALKELPASAAADSLRGQALRKEFATLASLRHPNLVEVYELDEPLDAFGVLQRERPPEATAASVGTEAVVSKKLCLARRGRFYLKAKALGGQLSATSCQSLLGPIASQLEAASDPPELALLPVADRVAGTTGYTRERYLGLSSLVRCVHADYRSGDHRYLAFVMVRATWESIAKDWDVVPGQAVPVVQREIPYTGWVAVGKTKRAVMGVVSDDRDAAVKRLLSLISSS